MNRTEYKELMIARNKAAATHNMSKSPEYAAWRGIKRRCYNPSFRQYADYGGRGIVMCDRWLQSFESFLEDMGLRPEGYSIERLNNNGDYTPENCIWAPKKQQARNRTDSHVIEFRGQKKTIAEWAEDLNNPQLYNRIHRGWSIERALTTPFKERPNAKKQRL